MFDSRFASLLRRLSALALCILLLPPSAPARAAFPKPLTVSFTVVTYQNRARSALKQINSLRKENGLAPLVMPADLEKAAIQRAAELFVFFDHDRPDLSAYDTVDDAYACGQTSLAVAECIAAGYSNADKLMDDWRENALDTLLDGDFTHAGLACVYVKGSYNEYYWALYLQQQPVGFSAREADAAATIGDRKPMLSATPYAKHTSLSVYVKGASGYVLYRATSKTGRYAKVDEQATTKRWTLKLEHEDLSRAYYYKVRAYKNSGGKRMYSEYSTPVRVSP